MTESVLEKIDRLYREAYNLALDEVQRLARKAMKQNPQMHEFCMAMGSFSFHDVNGEQTERNDKDEFIGAEELENFVAEVNWFLRITGEPMRFTVDGPVKTDW